MSRKTYEYRGCKIVTDDYPYRYRRYVAYGPDGLLLRWVHANEHYMGKLLEGTTLEYMRYLIDTQTLRTVAKPEGRKVARIKTPRADSLTADRFPGERNDCTVRAISIARCIPYAEAHALCKTLFGRVDRKGTFGTDLHLSRVDWCKRVPIEIRREYHASRRISQRVVNGPKTVDAFALAYPKGHFLVLVDSHTLAICDGVVYDGKHASGLRRVEAAFEVIA